MAKSRLEPGLIRIFRYFTAVAMVYYALIIVYTALQTGQWIVPQQVLLYVNFITNLFLFGYLSVRWLERKFNRWYLPLALMTATVIPIFSNLIYFVDPATSLNESITRSWIILPILLVPLVLIAWQYRFRFVFLFTVFVAVIQFFILIPFVRPITFETLPYIGIPIVQAFAFGIVGHIVTRLMEIQRRQRQQLIQANIQLAQHANTLERLAISRERNRIARELHDTLAHTLSGLAVNLEAIKITLDEQEFKEARTLVDHALGNTRNGLTDTRRALKALRPQHLEDLGLELAVANLAESAATRAGFDLTLQIDSPLPDLTHEVEQCFYRIAQEALENIIRHAEARHVILHLEQNANSINLIIQDDGVGFVTKEMDLEKELGIQGMRERAIGIGARFELKSDIEAGTHIHLSWEHQ